MDIKITFDIDEIDTCLIQDDNQLDIPLSVNIIKSLKFQGGDFYYDTSCFKDSPCERKILVYLKKLMMQAGLNLSKDLYKKIRLHKGCGEYLLLQLK